MQYCNMLNCLSGIARIAKVANLLCA